MKKYRNLVAEFIGTAILVLGGCGTAILAAPMVGVLGVALAFGISLALITYTIGHISGGHVNPAVTIGLAVNKKFPWKDVPGYVVAQVLGGLVGAAILLYVATATPGFELVDKNFAVNGFGDLSPTGVTMRAAFLFEIVMTAILSFAVVATRHKDFPAGFAGVSLGAALGLVHLISIPVTNTSVNPARSIAVALYVGGAAVSQLWLFIVAPIIGGIAGVWIYRQLDDGEVSTRVP